MVKYYHAQVELFNGYLKVAKEKRTGLNSKEKDRFRIHKNYCASFEELMLLGDAIANIKEPKNLDSEIKKIIFNEFFT